MRFLGGFAVLVIASGTVHAGGQLVGDTGTQSMQRAGAFAAKADDPSAMVFNPAGIARTEKRQFQVGANLVNLNLQFDRFGTYENGDPFPEVNHDEQFQPIPYIGLVWPIGKLVVGGGLFAPQGYPKRNFPMEVTTSTGNVQAAPQRYDAVEQSSQVVSPTIAAGYRVTEKLSVGVRASWGIGRFNSMKFVQGIPNEGEDPGNDTMTRVKTADNFIPSAGIGVHYTVNELVEVGFSFNTPSRIRSKGTTQTTLGANLQALAQQTGNGSVIEPVPDAEARCAPGGTPEALRACVNLTLPATASAGVRFIARDRSGRERGDIELDLRWENWSNASDTQVIVDGRNTLVGTPLDDTVDRHGLRDVVSLRIGASGRFDTRHTEVELRAGVGYESGAAPMSWTRLDIDGGEKYIGAAGVGVEFNRFRFDLGLSVIDSPTRQVRDVPLADTSLENRVQPDAQVPLSGATPVYNPINAGEYKASYFVGSAGLTTWW